MLSSGRYRTVDVILEEGSSEEDDFIEQEARLAEEALWPDRLNMRILASRRLLKSVFYKYIVIRMEVDTKKLFGIMHCKYIEPRVVKA